MIAMSVPLPCASAQVAKAENDGVFRQTSNGVCFSIDTTLAPDLADWSKNTLLPTVVKWYPQLVTVLPGYKPERIDIVFEADMGGIAASTWGTRIGCNALWMRNNRYEALGAIIHEVAHVVQAYHRPAANGEPIPSWVVEGIADYFRWYFYEPGRGNPRAASKRVPSGEYDAGYRVSAVFLRWLTDTYDKEIVRKLNDVCRNGSYGEGFWQTELGKTASELGAEWKVKKMDDATIGIR